MKPIILEYEFKNFVDALDFVNQVGSIAEWMNHHPNISIHDYKHVRLEIYTHSSHSITEKDLELKQKICDLKW